MVGAKVYDRFVALVQERERLRVEGVALPHPAVRSAEPRHGCRARPSRSRVVAALTSPGSASAGAVARVEPRQSLERVVVRRTRASAWSPGCGRTGPLRPGTTRRGRRPARPRTRRTVPWTPSKTASGCALPRSADGVPFSRELLVTPGPHIRVPPPTARPYGPSRPPVHCSGFRPARPTQVRRTALSATGRRCACGASGAAGHDAAGSTHRAHPAHRPGVPASCHRNLYADRRARVRPPGDGGPVPPAGRGGPHARHAADRGPRAAALPRAGPAGLHRLRHDRRRRGRAGRRDPDAAHRPAAAGERRRPDA